MLQKNRYITCGIQNISEKNPLLYLKLFNLYDEMVVDEKDYLQVFILRVKATEQGVVQEIYHSQEVPEYHSVCQYYTDTPIEEKIYIIDDGNNITMLLASEY